MDMIRILQFLVLAFGLKELFNAMEYHKQKKKKWVIASFFRLMKYNDSKKFFVMTLIQ